MKKRKIIIDTDPGIDDAFGIITALKYENFNVLGLTIVAGNIPLEKCVNNALGIINLCGSDCKVYKGSATSLKNYKKEENSMNSSMHGGNGLGEIVLKADKNSLSEISAVDFILKTVKENPYQIELITLGPLTNIALAIQKDPETMKKIKKIWSMGGGVSRGNRTVVAEFNYWFDPEAANIVYSIGEDVEINMIGLDVTYKTSFTMNDLFFIKKEGGKIGIKLDAMAMTYTNMYWERYKIPGCVIHDLVAVMIAIDPTLCENEKIYRNINLRVEENGMCRGQSLVDIYGHRELKTSIKNATVYMGIDYYKYKKMFIEILFGDKIKLYEKYILNNFSITG